MKKSIYSYVFLVILLLGFTAVSNAQDNSALVGEWNPMGAKLKDKESKYMDIFEKASMLEMKIKYVFKADSTFELINGGEVTVKGKFIFDKTNSIINLKGKYREMTAKGSPDNFEMIKGDWKDFEKGVNVKELRENLLVLIRDEGTPYEYFVLYQRAQQ